MADTESEKGKPTTEPEQYQQAYRDLQQLLHRMQRALDAAARDDVQAGLQSMQQRFQSILNFDLEKLPTAQAVNVQSCQTEINKQLRLLNTDLMFWQTARQPATQQQRQGQLQERLTLLQRYCEAILAVLLDEDNPAPSPQSEPP